MDDNRDNALNGSHEAELTDVERRLSALEPAGAKLDAAAIMRQARRPVESPVAAPPASKSPGWLSLGASWTCGALAGAVVTLIVLSRSVGPTEQGSVPGESAARRDTPVANTPVAQTPFTETPFTETPFTETPFTETPAGNNVVDDLVEPTKSNWSRSEMLVTTQLRQLALPNSLEQTQLRAGSYASLTTRSGPDQTAGIAAPTSGSPVEPGGEGQTPSPDTASPSSNLDPHRLLQELLGDVPNSVL